MLPRHDVHYDADFKRGAKSPAVFVKFIHSIRPFSGLSVHCMAPGFSTVCSSWNWMNASFRSAALAGAEGDNYGEVCGGKAEG